MAPQPFVLPGAEAAAGGGSAPTPLAALGPCMWHKRMSEILWELCKEAALGDSTVVISTTKNRALQAFFFPMLSWHSSSLEVVILKSFGVYSVFLFPPYCTVSHLPVSPQFWCFTFWICWIQAQCFEWFHWPCRSACQHRYISFRFTFIYANFTSPSHLQAESNCKASCASQATI